VVARGFLTLPGREGEEGKGERRAVTKVLLRPVTGRRHQLRVHTLHMGYPIGAWLDCMNDEFDRGSDCPRTHSHTTVGDTTYTGDTAAPRMMLHAASLTLPFPAGKVWVVNLGWARQAGRDGCSQLTSHTSQGPGCTVSVKTTVDPFESYFQAM
jgi:hypothetical protein